MADAFMSTENKRSTYIKLHNAVSYSAFSGVVKRLSPGQLQILIISTTIDRYLLDREPLFGVLPVRRREAHANKLE